MKILMINKFLYPRGGAETYFLRLGAYLESQGHDLWYFGMDDAANTVGNPLGLYTTNMDFHGKGLETLAYPFRIIYSGEAKKKLNQIIKKFHPDIIHMNNINFQLTPAIIEEGAKMGIPMVQTVHDYQMICPNHMLYNGNAICEKCVQGSAKNCIKQNCIHGSRIKSVIGTMEADLYKKRKTYELVDRYISPSYFLQKKLEQRSMYQGKIQTIHNFIEAPKTMNHVEKKGYVLYFGRLSEEKGMGILLQAMKQLPEIQFVVAGDGPLKDLFKDMDHVKYVGFLKGDKLKRCIAEAAFTLYPSIWYENCPLSVLESEALGTPVIATALGGTTELIEDGKTGILLETPDGDCLAKAIHRLYQNTVLQKEMEENCVEACKQFLTLEDYGKKMIQVYEEVIAAKKKD